MATTTGGASPMTSAGVRPHDGDRAAACAPHDAYGDKGDGISTSPVEAVVAVGRERSYGYIRRYY